MNITREMLIDKSACRDGLEWFDGCFPGGGDYQAVINQAVKDDHPDYADWLLNKFGSTDDVLEVDIDLDGKYLFFAGTIKVTGKIKIDFYLRAGRGIKAGEGIEAGRGIEAGEGIEAGWGIKAGEGIEAGWGIKAGEGIKAGWGIKAGEGIEAGRGIKAGEGIEAGDDWGIYAGLRIRLSDQSIYAKISAKTKPNNLVCGVWTEQNNKEEVA